VLEAQIGALGCTRSVCSDADRHGATPGVRLSGFLGGNLRGIVELGLAGGWGTLTADVAPGANALELFGVDPQVLEQVIEDRTGQALAVDLTGLTVTGARLRAAQVGPALRIHLIPRGRATAWLGTGVGYHLWRGDYDTTDGPTRLDVHGIVVPIEAGAGAWLTKRLALAAVGHYGWTWHGLFVLDHPEARAAAPVRTVDDALDGRARLQDQLPHTWTVSAGLRATF
jgi:hypothetical protein